MCNPGKDTDSHLVTDFPNIAVRLHGTSPVISTLTLKFLVVFLIGLAD